MELLDLPTDTLLHIASFLDHKSLLQLEATCSALRSRVVTSSTVWLGLCKRWSEVVSLSEWSKGMSSPRALFRLLVNLERLIGPWSAQELQPRGGLLYVVWGHCCAIAYRVVPDPVGDELIYRRLFEVVGEPDGRWHLDLLTGRGGQLEVPLPGALRWVSEERREFFLESIAPPGMAPFAEGHPHHPLVESKFGIGSSMSIEEPSEASSSRRERQAAVRDGLFQQQLQRNTCLEDSASRSLGLEAARPRPDPHRPGVVLPAELRFGGALLPGHGFHGANHRPGVMQDPVPVAEADAGREGSDDRVQHSDVATGGAVIGEGGRTAEEERRRELGLPGQAAPAAGSPASNPSFRPWVSGPGVPALRTSLPRRVEADVSAGLRDASNGSAAEGGSSGATESSEGRRGASSLDNTPSSMREDAPFSSSRGHRVPSGGSTRPQDSGPAAQDLRQLGAPLPASGQTEGQGGFRQASGLREASVAPSGLPGRPRAAEAGAGAAPPRAPGADLRNRAAQYFLRLSGAAPSQLRAAQGSGAGRPIAGREGDASVASGSRQGEGEGGSSNQIRRVRVKGSRYARLPVEAARPERELAGLWTGLYGPHGLEILNVAYTEDGLMTATKILGDPNVPCSEITFQAFLSTLNQEPPPDEASLADMLADPRALAGEGDDPLPRFVKTYRGEGRIADYNFRDPKRVGGLLLIEASGRFAFIWKDMNFLIRFRRLSLPALLSPHPHPQAPPGPLPLPAHFQFQQAPLPPPGRGTGAMQVD